MGDGDSLTFKWTAASGAVPAASTKRGRRYSLRGSIRYIMASVMTAMRATFLPVGYPDSVAPEYITFQAWDSIQAMCSYLRGVLASKAIFEAVGVGNQDATALAATVTWIMRDGASMMGGLVFARWGGGRFDQDVKFWRLFADVSNDVGLTLEMFAPSCGPYFHIVACLAKVCTGLCGVSAGATRASIVSHFALVHNLSDVSAKEGSQETAVSLCGLLVGLWVALWFNLTQSQAWSAFLALTLIHVYGNSQGVFCLMLRTLNQNRACACVTAFLAGDEEGMTPRGVQAVEPLWPGAHWASPPKLGCIRVRRNPSVTLKFGCGVEDLCACAGGDVGDTLQAYSDEPFLAAAGLSSSRGAVLAIAFKPEATFESKLRAYFLACVFRERVLAAGRVPSPPLSSSTLRKFLSEARAVTTEQYPAFLASLPALGWQFDGSHLGGDGLVVQAASGYWNT